MPCRCMPDEQQQSCALFKVVLHELQSFDERDSPKKRCRLLFTAMHLHRMASKPPQAKGKSCGHGLQAEYLLVNCRPYAPT